MRWLSIENEFIHDKKDEVIKMKRISIQAKLEAIIETLEKGALVSAHDFLEVGNYEAVKRALVRLCDEGKLKRVLRGLYQTPNTNAFLKKAMLKFIVDLG